MKIKPVISKKTPTNSDKEDGELSEAEVINNLNSIRRAQKAYMSEYDVFVKVDGYPEYPSQGGTQFVQEHSPGFTTINWKPASPTVRGSYSVSTTSSDFVAEGVIDVGGDGVFLTYRATKDKPATPFTIPK